MCLSSLSDSDNVKTNPSRVYLSLVGNALIIIRSTSTDEKERKVGERAGRYHRECVHQSHVEFTFLILLRSFINLICVTLSACVKLPGPRRPVTAIEPINHFR